MKPLLLIASAIAALGAPLWADHHEQSITERLGYPSDAILLIVHGDDLGLAHSENEATFEAMAIGSVTSGSIMMPTPWITEVANHLRENPQTDLGIHLTLTAEWETYKWGPVAPIDQVSSLVDDSGYFYSSTGEFLENAKTDEVEKELRAQIELAETMGIDFTHFDAHMGAASATPELFEIYTRLGREYRVPIRMRPTVRDDPRFAQHLRESDIIPTSIVGAPSESYPDGMVEAYLDTLENLGPGLHEMVLHVAYDDAEMQAITVNHPLWGAKWRQIDYDVFTSAETSELLKRRSIHLITWRDIRDSLIRNK